MEDKGPSGIQSSHQEWVLLEQLPEITAISNRKERCQWSLPPTPPKISPTPFSSIVPYSGQIPLSPFPPLLGSPTLPLHMPLPAHPLDPFPNLEGGKR